MNAKSPKAPRVYDFDEQDRFRALLDRRDRGNRKANADIELGADRLIMTDSVTGLRYSVTIQSGSVVLVPL